jgi:transposase
VSNDLGCLADEVLAQYQGPEHSALRELINQLVALTEALTAEVAQLKADANRHSGNSSKPPSADTLAQRQAQKVRRKAWTNKGNAKRSKGKQPGAPGAHLAQVEHPDKVVPHPPEVCGGCGGSLAAAEVVSTETRQVFDLPEPRIVVTAHVAERRRCICGCVTAGVFPPEANAPATYGSFITGVASYLLAHQHLPVARTADFLSDVLGCPVSTGWVAGLLPRAAELLEGFGQDLRAKLIASPVLGTDETGTRISGERFWYHGATTDLLTLITCHKNRGQIGMRAAGVLPEFRGIAMHDRYAQYWVFDCLHAACSAHLLRDLAAVAETPSQLTWTEEMATLLLSAKDDAAAARDKGKEALTVKERKRIARAYDKIVTTAIRANPDPWLLGREHRTKAEKESNNLAIAFRELQPEILRFTENLAVWFTNNGCERGFRMVKIRQKISGCHRSYEGAEAFCAAWSYVSTARKHGANPLTVLVDLFRGNTWAIPDPAPG